MSEPRPVPCPEVRQRLMAYVDGEIEGEECFSIRRHLERCPPCERRAEVERGFRRVLRERLVREVAPAALLSRVRGALREESQIPAGAASIFHGWRLAVAGAGYALAAVLLVVWLISPAGLAPAPGGGEEASGAPGGAPPPVPAEALALVPVHLRGTIVCAPCERMHVPIERQILCEAYGHLNGVRDERGRVWTLVLDAPGGAERVEALNDGRLRGREVALDGDAIEKISYLIPRRVELP